MHVLFSYVLLLFYFEFCSKSRICAGRKYNAFFRLKSVVMAPSTVSVPGLMLRLDHYQFKTMKMLPCPQALGLRESLLSHVSHMTQIHHLCTL